MTKILNEQIIKQLNDFHLTHLLELYQDLYGNLYYEHSLDYLGDTYDLDEYCENNYQSVFDFLLDLQTDYADTYNFKYFRVDSLNHIYLYKEDYTLRNHIINALDMFIEDSWDYLNDEDKELILNNLGLELELEEVKR